VAIHSPPFFHVQQAIDAVAAGKHVLIAKPVAIDVAGCETIRQLAKDAAAKGIVVLADVQCRGDEFFQQGIQRVHDGAIGDLLFGECHYEADLIPLQSPDDTTPEGRLKNWIRHRDLAGDIITEQNIHALDIVSWAFGRPTRISGICGRGGRPDDIGDVSDHYALVFEFAKGAITFASRQYTAWGSPFLCDNRFVGNKAVFTSKFGGRVMIRGNKEAYWPGGESKSLYRSGSVTNVETFRAAIAAGKPEGNRTVDAAVETTLLTLFGEHAAKAGHGVTWDEFIRDAKAVKPDLSGLKA
jgi:predicted dehydrogenase